MIDQNFFLKIFSNDFTIFLLKSFLNFLVFVERIVTVQMVYLLKKALNILFFFKNFFTDYVFFPIRFAIYILIYALIINTTIIFPFKYIFNLNINSFEFLSKGQAIFFLKVLIQFSLVSVVIGIISGVFMGSVMFILDFFFPENNESFEQKKSDEKSIKQRSKSYSDLKMLDDFDEKLKIKNHRFLNFENDSTLKNLKSKNKIDSDYTMKFNYENKDNFFY